MFQCNRYPVVMACAVVATLLLNGRAAAYVGPGAGMEFFGYAMSLAAMIGVAFLSVLMWPFYAALRWFRGIKVPAAEQPPAETSPTTSPSDQPAPATPPERADTAPPA